jgi:hypothetical protein
VAVIGNSPDSVDHSIERIDFSQLCRPVPVEPRPMELIHFDLKNLDCFEIVGQRIARD